ncbi:MAG TPA: hypothetical protein VFN22_10525 [Gemmatimonadales bacterium]|nr:hypothetical protein [Gemmatimonadales bacterium]
MRHCRLGPIGLLTLLLACGVVLFRTEDDNGIATLTVRRVLFPR